MDDARAGTAGHPGTAPGPAPVAPPAAGRDGTGWRDEVAFLRRVLIVAAVVVLALLVWTIRDTLLLAFAAVVVAALLLTAASPFERFLGFAHGWALATAGALILAVLVAVGMLVGSEVQAQVSELRRQLPQAVHDFEQRFGVDVPRLGDDRARGDQDQSPEQRGTTTQGAAERLSPPRRGTTPGPERQSPPPSAASPRSDLETVGSAAAAVASYIATLGRTLFEALSALILVVVGGVFIAANTEIYRQGLVKLLPRNHHARAEDVLLTSGRALRLWLLAQLLSMAIVGTLYGLGAWALGLPSPLALGLFAALVEFVPIVGPVVGAVPVLLLALAQGGTTLLWALGLVLLVQQVESNLIMPLVQERTVHIPPALLLFALLAVGAVFGLSGLLLAAPLTVVGFVMVKKLYVRQTLGEQTEVPGEKPPG